MTPASLRARLIAAYTGLTIVGFGLLALVAGRQISDAAIVDFERGLDTQTLLIANGLTETISGIVEGDPLQADLTRLLTAYGLQTNARITIIGTDGHAWADSSGTLPTEPQSAYPEVAAALSGETSRVQRDDGTGAMTYYVASPVVADEGIIAVVQLSVPSAIASSLVTQRWAMLAAGVILLAVLGLIAGLLLAYSLSRPLEQLQRSAMRLASGDLSERVVENGPDEIRQLGASFNYLAGQVQAMLDEQRAFASNASHELRAPLTAIRVRSEALRGGRLDEQTSHQYITEIDDEAVHLTVLIEDLILLSRLDAGRIQLSDEWVEPARFARALMREMQPVAEARRVTLSLEAADTVEIVHASLNHLRVVFRNLLDNAIKYTPPGGIVTWRLCVENESLTSRITDTGIGISPADMPHLFQRFFRADKAHTRATPGVGLGLALTRSIVGVYGGRVEVESAGHGKGTTASVYWPLKPRPNIG